MFLLRYISRRLFFSIFVLVGVSILIFTISRLVPGDPARLALGGTASESAVEELRVRMNLDKPLYIQYYFWAKNAVKGDFGKSLVSQRAVIEDIKEYFPASIELALYAAFIVAFLGLWFGILAGWNRNSPKIDNFVRIISYLGVATPNYVMAIFVILLFSKLFPLFPTIGRLDEHMAYPIHITGLVGIDALITGDFELFINSFKHIILPAFSLAMASMSVQTRVIRTSIVDNLGKDYISAARLYGIPERLIKYKYLLKPSLIPAITLFSHGVIMIMAGAFLVESIFNWPGLARYSMNAIMQKDINAMTAVVVLYGFIFVFVNLTVDIIVSYLDPRINLGQ